MHYQLSTLGGGIRVITESMPEVRSIALGCWIDTGSRDEGTGQEGCSHFLEHLLFKGSERMSAQDIARAFDSIGAQSNAFTTKEFTCYWARLRDADTAVGIEILAEMLQRPAFRQNELDSERQVVLEEINMNEDDPADVAHERFSRALWAGSRLALPIMGSRQSVTAMSRDTLAGYWQTRYAPESLVFAAAGSLEHDVITAMVEAEFAGWDGSAAGHDYETAAIETRVDVERRDTEQAHLVFGGEGLARGDKRRFAAAVLNHVLGGGMSSRLFRKIREDRGLAYSIHSFRSPHVDTGAWGVYTGTTPHQAKQVLELIIDEVETIAAKGIDADELERAKGFMQGALALATEDASSRMTRLGRAELAGVEHLDVDEVVRRFDQVTLEDVHEVAREVFDGPRALGVTGPFAPDDLADLIRR